LKLTVHLNYNRTSPIIKIFFTIIKGNLESNKTGNKDKINTLNINWDPNQ